MIEDIGDDCVLMHIDQKVLEIRRLDEEFSLIKSITYDNKEVGVYAKHFKSSNRHYFVYRSVIEARDENFDLVQSTKMGDFSSGIRESIQLSEDLLLIYDYGDRLFAV